MDSRRLPFELLFYLSQFCPHLKDHIALKEHIHPLSRTNFENFCRKKETVKLFIFNAHWIAYLRAPALVGVAQWVERGLQTMGSPVRFPVGEHAWVAGQAPSRGYSRSNHTLMFLIDFISRIKYMSLNYKDYFIALFPPKEVINFTGMKLSFKLVLSMFFCKEAIKWISKSIFHL